MMLVVTVQVVNAALRWSAQRPFPVDLRSARAVPAPPLVMVGYSSRLALSTTMTGLVFSALSQDPDWRISVVVAIPFLAWSTWRLVRVQQRWLDPVQRSARGDVRRGLRHLTESPVSRGNRRGGATSEATAQRGRGSPPSARASRTQPGRPRGIMQASSGRLWTKRVTTTRLTSRALGWAAWTSLRRPGPPT